MRKIFYTYLTPEDPYRKYTTNYDNKFTGVLNDQPGNMILGEVACYDKIINEAKLMGYDFIETAQVRRHLDMPEYPNTDKVYHTWYYLLDDNVNFWYGMHGNDLLEKAAKVIVTKYPEYAEATRFVFTNNLIFPHNMFAMSLERFEQYNNWLRSILCMLDIPLDPPKCGSLLAERLFTIWCIHNFAMKDQAWVTAKVYNKNTGKLIENAINGVAD